LLPTFLRTRWAALSSALAVEVGGPSVQSAVLIGGTVEFVPGAAPFTEATPYGLAAPGLVVHGRVLGAHHLGWMDVEAWREWGYDRRPDVSLNDAEAAAFGEWLLRDGEPDDLLYIGIGTGVGAVRIAGGELVPVEFGHLTSFGDAVCGGCGCRGCLDANIGGHALPTPLGSAGEKRVIEALAQAIPTVGLPVGATVVFGGGLARSCPELVRRLAAVVGHLRVEASAAPGGAKSAAYVGVLDRLARSGSPSGRR
jgi:hypothetical protein